MTHFFILATTMPTSTFYNEFFYTSKVGPFLIPATTTPTSGCFHLNVLKTCIIISFEATTTETSEKLKIIIEQRNTQFTNF